jgi:uncharacterized lipoprotein YmbA
MHNEVPENIVAAGSYTVAVGPVLIPDYMNRPQIITRSSTYEIYLDEFNRWAGALDDDIARVLSENISFLLSQQKIFASPWEWSSTATYQVPIDVKRFDVMPEGNVLLIANWSIIDQKTKQTLITLETQLSEHISGQDYNAKVSAMSKALEAFSKNIADVIKARTDKVK